MPYSFNNIGAVATQDGSGNVTPGAPTVLNKQLLVLATGAFSGTLTITIPAGWKTLDPATPLANSFYLIGRVAQADSEAMPVIAWGGGAVAWGICSVFDCAGLVDNNSIIIDSNGGNRSSSSSNIVGTVSARTPAADNCLALFAGSKNKTATSNTATITATDSSFTQDYGAVVTGATQTARTLQHWIQTTKTATAGGANISIADSATFRSILTFLQPPLAPPGMQML